MCVLFFYYYFVYSLICGLFYVVFNLWCKANQPSEDKNQQNRNKTHLLGGFFVSLVRRATTINFVEVFVCDLCSTSESKNGKKFKWAHTQKKRTPEEQKEIKCLQYITLNSKFRMIHILWVCNAFKRCAYVQRFCLLLPCRHWRQFRHKAFAVCQVSHLMVNSYTV